MPLVARRGAAPFQRVGEQPAEAQAPLADALAADYHAAGGQDELDIAQAKAETVIQPMQIGALRSSSSPCNTTLGHSSLHK